MAYRYPTFQEWFAELPENQREKATKLLELMRSNACHDPEDWVRSEMEEDFAQCATYLLLHSIWRHEIDSPWAESPENWITNFSTTMGSARLPVFDDATAALKRIAAAGVRPQDLGAVARLIAYSTAFGVLYRIDQGSDGEAAGEVPGWSLRETTADGELTGRDLGGLHESLLSIHEDEVKAESSS